jgi:hypothetical protein
MTHLSVPLRLKDLDKYIFTGIGSLASCAK